MAHYLKTYRRYFDDFIQEQDKKTKIKIVSVINLILEFDRTPVEYLKKIRGTKNIYEIRVHTKNSAIRVFCLFDGNILVLLNSFRKKSRRTPQQEIRLAIRLHKEYHEEKSKHRKY